MKTYVMTLKIQFPEEHNATVTPSILLHALIATIETDPECFGLCGANVVSAEVHEVK